MHRRRTGQACTGLSVAGHAHQRLHTVLWPHRTFVPHTDDAGLQQHSKAASGISRRSALLQLSSTALLGSVGLVLGSQGLLSPAQPAWAAGEPRELTGAVKAAVDKALDKFVVKSKVHVMACRQFGYTAMRYTAMKGRLCCSRQLQPCGSSCCGSSSLTH